VLGAGIEEAFMALTADENDEGCGSSGGRV
jgi:hypothetical protein